MNISQSFISEIDKVAQQPIPLKVMERARHSLLDYLAVTCSGATFQKEKLKGYFNFANPEEGKFNAIGTGRKLALKEAVFLNGLNAHALDYDDGTNSGIIHLGSPIFSQLIPLSQRYGISVDDMLCAAIIGYETSYTLAVSIQPNHKALGYHATGTCGVIGSAIAAAYMLGFSNEERYQAFATACVSASGMLKVLDDGSELKPYNVAKSTLLALTCIQLAKSGFKGHIDPLGGYRGFLKMMVGDEHVDIKPTMLNGTYAIMKSYTKPYASCRYTHPPVEATISLRNKYNIHAEDITKIEIKTYDLAVSGHDHTQIKGSYSAKMSTPYSTAVALIAGKAGLQEFSEDYLDNEVVKSLINKIHVTSDEEMSKIFPQKQSAIVSIETNQGVFTQRVDFPKGEPENPLTEQEFYERFANLMKYANIKKDIYEAIYKKVSQPSTMVDDLMKNL